MRRDSHSISRNLSFTCRRLPYAHTRVSSGSLGFHLVGRTLDAETTAFHAAACIINFTGLGGECQDFKYFLAWSYNSVLSNKDKTRLQL